MSLETKSKALKEIIATYDSAWLLGDLHSLIHAGKERVQDQLGNLSSPMRQLYYLAGLNISSDPTEEMDFMYDPEKWGHIVDLLNEIEIEYQQLFYTNIPEEVTEDWVRVRQVALPSFLSYFNQGPLNYEEQVIDWVRNLFVPLDAVIEEKTGLTTEDFITFYNNLDQLHQQNFQGHTTNKEFLRPDWDKYTKIRVGVIDGVPDFIREFGERNKVLNTFVADRGIIDRFHSEELVTDKLPLDKVIKILNLLSITRQQTGFLYYTATKPGNPLYENPIVYIGSNLYQVFEVKQVIHAIEKFLEQTCTQTQQQITKYNKLKGNLLEDKILQLFFDFFKADYKFFKGYYVNGCEQDILFLWKNYAFIIEAKGYSIREPFRNPEKAFIRIKDDFDKSIGYGYTQTVRVENKFINKEILRVMDEHGRLIEEIDTSQYEADFSIIVNLNSFGQIQCDLSVLLELENEENVYPWAVKLNDLEIFFLTMMDQGKNPDDLVEFLLLREELHGKLICADELEICGAYLTDKLYLDQAMKTKIVVMTPGLGNIFDELYHKGMGFKNEKYLYEKQSGKFLFF